MVRKFPSVVQIALYSNEIIILLVLQRPTSSVVFRILTVPCLFRPAMYSKRRPSRNPFMENLIAKTTHSSSNERHRQSQYLSIPANEMTFFSATSNHFLNPLSSRKKAPRYPEESEQYDELERSFASNVSLNSPPRELISLAASDCEPMDISPAPVKVQSKHRPRAFTGGSRLFGNDLSNNKAQLLPSPQMAEASAKPVVATQSSNKRIQRSALPTEWLAAARKPAPPPSPPSPNVSSTISIRALKILLTSIFAVAYARAIFSYGRPNGC